MLINHQKAKHFKCHYCHKKLNTGSGLVIHIAQLHKETIFKVPNAIEGRDTPELEIYGMMGVPLEDLQKHREGLPIGPFKRNRLTEPGAGMLPLLAAQKAAIPELEPQPQDIAKLAPPPPPSASSSSAPISPNDDKGQKPAETVLSAPATTYASAPATTFASPQMPTINTMATPAPPVQYYASMPAPPYGYQYPYPQQSYYPYPQHYGYPQQPAYAYPGYPQHYGFPQQPPYPPTAVSPIPLAPQVPVDNQSQLISPAGSEVALKILPRIDEVSGKMILGSIIVAPDLEVSIVPLSVFEIVIKNILGRKKVFATKISAQIQWTCLNYNPVHLC